SCEWRLDLPARRCLPDHLAAAAIRALAGVALVLVRRHLDRLAGRGHPVHAALLVAVVDLAVLGAIVLALGSLALGILMLFIQVVERRRARHEQHLLLGAQALPRLLA